MFTEPLLDARGWGTAAGDRQTPHSLSGWLAKPREKAQREKGEGRSKSSAGNRARPPQEGGARWEPALPLRVELEQFSTCDQGGPGPSWHPQGSCAPAFESRSPRAVFEQVE